MTAIRTCETCGTILPQNYKRWCPDCRPPNRDLVRACYYRSQGRPEPPRRTTCARPGCNRPITNQGPTALYCSNFCHRVVRTDRAYDKSHAAKQHLYEGVTNG